MERTGAYRFTVQSRDDQRLVMLRQRVRAFNMLRREFEPGRTSRLVVAVRARLGRENPLARSPEMLARRRCCRGAQIVPLKFGSRFDVYVYERHRY